MNILQETGLRIAQLVRERDADLGEGSVVLRPAASAYSGARAPASGREVMRGALGEIGVPELLQVLGVLGLHEVRVDVRAPARSGWIHVDGDTVLDARTGGATGNRALRRLLEWREGTFRVTHEGRPDAFTIGEPIEKCLLDAVLYQDLHQELESAGPAFFVDRERLSDAEVSDRALLVLALVEAVRDLSDVLEQSPLPDVETLEVLTELWHQGLVTGCD